MLAHDPRKLASLYAYEPAAITVIDEAIDRLHAVRLELKHHQQRNST
jgi:hypothetical protein